MKHLMITIAAASLMVAVTGCGGESKLATVPVEGTLTVDGKPVGPLVLTLTPTSEDLPSVGAPVGADGSFKLGTYEDGDGAPPGSYDVLLATDPMSPQMVPNVMPAKVEIADPGDGSTVALDIQLQGAGRGMGGPLPKPDF